MPDRKSPLAGLGVCMTGFLLENAVCTTGSSVRLTWAVCLGEIYLLEMLCACQEESFDRT